MTARGCGFGRRCDEHDMIHGAEAEELRKGIELLIEDGDRVSPAALQRLLDHVDARDSLSYLEAEARRKKPRTR